MRNRFNRARSPGQESAADETGPFPRAPGGAVGQGVSQQGISPPCPYQGRISIGTSLAPWFRTLLAILNRFLGYLAGTGNDNLSCTASSDLVQPRRGQLSILRLQSGSCYEGVSFNDRKSRSNQRLPLIMLILLINPSAPQAISKLKKVSLELLVSTAGRLPKALMTRLQQTLHLIVNHAAQRG